MPVSHPAGIICTLAIATFAIAFVATAFVQLLKELLPIRRRFQRNYLRSWFTTRLKERGKQVTNEQLKRAERDLIHLATGGDRNAFYDLETAQLCGQMNSAAQIALAYPDRHPDLLRFLAPEAEDADLDRVSQTASFPARADTVSTPQSQADMNELLDARNRVTHNLQRTIDALQISMSFRWKLYLQLTVYTVCLILSLVTILTTKGATRFSWLEIPVMAVVAGYLSPVISDFAGVIERLRKR
jgi:hypothetical protein